jgi:hypothetical protein
MSGAAHGLLGCLTVQPGAWHSGDKELRTHQVNISRSRCYQKHNRHVMGGPLTTQARGYLGAVGVGASIGHGQQPGPAT